MSDQEKKKPGPAPERLVIDEDAEEALARLLKNPKQDKERDKKRIPKNPKPPKD